MLSTVLLQTTSAAHISTSALGFTSTLVLSSSSLRASNPTGTSNRGTRCSDSPLPIAWSGGGVHTCSTYQQLDLAYCNHVELQVACCFCGGGQSAPTPMSTAGIIAAPMPATGLMSTPKTTSVVSVTPSLCVDGPLPPAWSGGGVHTCATYEQHGGSAYCAHQELAEVCCFCVDGGVTRRLRGCSAASEHSRLIVFRPLFSFFRRILASLK